MRILDRNLEFHGVSIESLMERAGTGIAEVLLEKMGAAGKRVTFFSGTGNNAGDGFVAARYLHEHATVTIVLAKPPEALRKGPAEVNFRRLPKGVEILAPPLDYGQAAAKADLLVDGLMGTGIQGTLREPYRAMVEALNGSGKPVISIDVPSGTGGDVVVQPQLVVALHAEKAEVAPQAASEVAVVDIGISPEQERLIGPGEFLTYPRPQADAHKGESGRVLVVAGGPFTGAPALAAMGAYRIGSDVVHVATPTASHRVVAAFSPTLIVHRLDGESLSLDHVPTVAALADGKEAAVLGPGLGRARETLEAVRELIRSLSLPLVLDADAITAVAEDLTCLEGKSGVITPHRVEFQRLSGVELDDDLERRVAAVREFAATLPLTVLLKGRYDLVSDGQQVKVNTTGNPGMTVGGTGDVLAGVVGGLLGKGLLPFDAARLAAFANGYAGDIAFRGRSFGMIATDVLEHLPDVLIEFL